MHNVDNDQQINYSRFKMIKRIIVKKNTQTSILIDNRETNELMLFSLKNISI